MQLTLSLLLLIAAWCAGQTQYMCIDGRRPVGQPSHMAKSQSGLTWPALSQLERASQQLWQAAGISYALSARLQSLRCPSAGRSNLRAHVPAGHLTYERLLQAFCMGTRDLGLGKGDARLVQLSQPQDGAAFGLSTATAGSALLSASGGKPHVLQFQPGELSIYWGRS